MSIKVSICILTYNRSDELKELLDGLTKIKIRGLQIIVVDNASTDSAYQIIERTIAPDIEYIRLPRNMGTEGRNIGMVNAHGEIIITLDDDIIGIDDLAIENIVRLFQERQDVAAVCFKVVDYYTGKITNWCHPYRMDEYSETELLTAEITEGAVAYRASTLRKVGYYPHNFFISNEGADLACRILEEGKNIVYNPCITVRHKHSQKARENWRRYYYDTRNHLWLALRNYRFWYGFRYVTVKVVIMMIYSIRDGYFRYWLKGVIDSILGIPVCIRERSVISKITEKRIKEINRNKPGFICMLKNRWNSKGVRI